MKIFKVYLMLLFVSNALFSQQGDDLKNQIKAGIGFQGLDISAEFPLTSNRFLVEASAGIGGVYYSGSNYTGYSQREFTGYELGTEYGTSFFGKVDARCYLNRDKRERKGKKTYSNSGSYIGLSSKYNQNHESLGKTMVYELYFGQHVPIGKKFLFSYFGGFGHMQNMDQDYGAAFPSVGVKFSYIFLKF